MNALHHTNQQSNSYRHTYKPKNAKPIATVKTTSYKFEVWNTGERFVVSNRHVTAGSPRYFMCGFRNLEDALIFAGITDVSIVNSITRGLNPN